MEEALKSVALRFVRVFLSTALAQMAVVATQSSPETWGDMNKWLIMLATSGIAAGLAALDKAIRYAPLS